MWTGTVEAADPGESRRKGVAPARDLMLWPDDPSRGALAVQHRPSPEATANSVRLLKEIAYAEFERCPICLRPGAVSREHVPPASLGGKVRTLTCEPCNNRLGARVEAELFDWNADATRNARAAGPGAIGLRRIPRILRRTDGQGNFVLVAEDPDPAVRDMLVNGQLTLHWRPPDRDRYRLAALKHAYLAACCQLGVIPSGDEADRIRRDLIAARDAPSNAVVPPSETARSLGLMRSFDPPSGPSLALASVAGDGRVWLSLAGTLLVQWPFTTVGPGV